MLDLDKVDYIPYHKLIAANYPSQVQEQTNKFVPRKHQVDIVYKAYDLACQMDLVCIESYCGSGKTKTMALMNQMPLELGCKILVVGFREVAMSGNIHDWRQVFGNKFKFNNLNELDANCDVYFFTVNGIHSILKREPLAFNKIFDRIDIVIGDEVHHLPKDDDGNTQMLGKVYKKLFEDNNKHKFSFTATHCRMDKMLPCGKEKPDIRYTMYEGIKDGICPPLHGIAVITNATDFEEKNQGDYYKFTVDFESVSKQVLKLYMNDVGWGHCLFMRRNEECRQMRDLLNKDFGREAFVVLDEDSTSEEREQYKKDIADHKLIGYITVEVGVEGISIDRLKYCHVICKTGSIIKLTQMIGRVVRYVPGKIAVVVDYMVKKAEIIAGCVGFWDFCNREGSKLNRTQMLLGENGFDDCPEITPLSISYAQLTEWITPKTELDWHEGLEELMRKKSA